MDSRSARPSFLRSSVQKPMPESDRARRVAAPELFAVHQHLAAVVLVYAKHGAHDLASSGADQTEETDDLALADGEGDIFKHALAAKVLDLQHGGGDLGRLLQVEVFQRTADHVGDQLILRKFILMFADDIFAVADDGDIIG